MTLKSKMAAVDREPFKVTSDIITKSSQRTSKASRNQILKQLIFKNIYTVMMIKGVFTKTDVILCSVDS